MIGNFASPLAGHDAEKIYVVVGEESGRVMLADGNGKTLANPKVKNRKHILFLQDKVSPKLEEMIRNNAKGCDEMIKQELRGYLKGKKA